VLEKTRPLGARPVPLERAVGLCLAEDIRADRDMPPADRSAMDGYAVRAADLTDLPARLRLVGEVAAGSPARPEVRPGTCVRILTGANLPPGADTVVMVEQTEEEDGRVLFRPPVRPGTHILRRGEDAARGTVLLTTGTLLGALQVGVCAAVGKTEVRVWRRPRTAVLCTGAELCSPEEKVGAHQIRNSNGPMLRAALAAWGYRRVAVATSPDDPDLLTAKLRESLEGHDVVLLTGGVSVGKYDYVRQAVERVGGQVQFHGVAMKPGKPLLYGTVGEDRHVFGLPGNPLSTMTGFYGFALPALRRLSGVAAEDCRPSLCLPLASRVSSKGGRTRFVLARMASTQKGLAAEPVLSQSSADLVAGGRAQGVIAVPPNVREVDAGTLVEFRAWEPLP
jgi:molybdopterin molybdotransferase